MNFNELSKTIFEQNKAVGWWDDPNRCIWTTLQLVSTEIAEATEGERKNLMDDHLPDRKMGEVELADAAIRVLDLGGRIGIRHDPSFVRSFPYGVETIGAIHLGLNRQLVVLSDCIQWYCTSESGYYSPRHIDGSSMMLAQEYSRLLFLIEQAATRMRYDLEGAIRDKLAYNKTRADHKRENRAKEHGKAF